MIDSLVEISQWYIGLDNLTLVQIYRLRKGHQGTDKLGPIIHLKSLWANNIAFSSKLCR